MEALALEGGRGYLDGGESVGRRPIHQAVSAVAQQGDVCQERDGVGPPRGVDTGLAQGGGYLGASLVHEANLALGAAEGNVHLDDLPPGRDTRVEYDDGLPLACGVDATGEAVGGVAEVTAREDLRLGMVRAGVVVGGADAGTGHGVVELVEEQTLPSVREVTADGDVDAREPRGGDEALARKEGLLDLAVAALHLGDCRIAASRVVLELLSDDGELVPLGPHRAEEGLGAGHDQVGEVGIALEPVDGGQVAARRPPAVVPDAEEAHGGRGARGRASDVVVDLFGPRVVVASGAAGDDLTSVGGPPAEDRTREVLLVGTRPEEAVGVLARAG